MVEIERFRKGEQSLWVPRVRCEDQDEHRIDWEGGATKIRRAGLGGGGGGEITRIRDPDLEQQISLPISQQLNGTVSTII